MTARATTPRIASASTAHKSDDITLGERWYASTTSTKRKRGHMPHLISNEQTGMNLDPLPHPYGLTGVEIIQLAVVTVFTIAGGAYLARALTILAGRAKA
jgi:hypothetical protein